MNKVFVLKQVTEIWLLPIFKDHHRIISGPSKPFDYLKILSLQHLLKSLTSVQEAFQCTRQDPNRSTSTVITMPRMPNLPEQGPGTKLVLKGLELAFPDIAERHKQHSNKDKHASDAERGVRPEKSRPGSSRHLNPDDRGNHSQSRHTPHASVLSNSDTRKNSTRSRDSTRASVHSNSRAPSNHKQSDHIPSASADRRVSLKPRASGHSTSSHPKPPKNPSQSGHGFWPSADP